LAEASDRAGFVSTTLAICGIALPALAVRVALISAMTGGPGAPDVPGFASDLGVSLLFAALVLFAARAATWLATGLALALTVAWVVAHQAQYEIALALDSLASVLDLRFLGSRTFIGGSVLWVSNAWLLAVSVAGSLLGVWFGTRAPTGARRIVAIAAVGALVLAVHPLLPLGEWRVGWRQQNLIHHNLEALAVLALGSRRTAAGDHASAVLERVPGMAADLGGREIGSLDRRPRNVLLVFLESVSGAFIPSLRETHGIDVSLSMPRLDAFAQTGLRYPDFVVQQRRTSRGLYAALCGELPNLLRATPKMTAYVKRPNRKCLPRVLDEAGYRTTFLQAAPLAFMLKDQFMPLAGFANVVGHDWFERGYENSVWGVDDRSFLEQSLRMIDQLRAEEGPWFLTMLTVGTHHPTIVPHDFEPDRTFRFARAISWLDLGVDDFVRALDERGVFEDTLVILTSDESRGLSERALGGARDETTVALTQNWGYLVVRTPEGLTGEVTEPFALMDLPISVLDYLGLADRGAHFYGRSVFRRYDEERLLFFSNNNLRTVGAFAPGGQLFLCSHRFDDCRTFDIPDGRIFSPGRVLRERDASGGIVQDVALRSVAVQRGGIRPDHFELVQQPSFQVKSIFEELIHGGQQLALKKGQWIEVEIEVDGMGGNGRPSIIEHRLSRDGKRLGTFSLNVTPGYRRTFEYTYAPPKDVTSVSARSLAKLSGGAGEMELLFHRAVMTVHTIGERPPTGVDIRRNDEQRIDAVTESGGS